MGQYWRCVNLDRHEYIDPYELGTGAKLWEQLANHPSAGTALIILCAAMPVARGGGDLDLDSNMHGPERTDPFEAGPKSDIYQEIAHRTIGRWAGDRIALVGDYAEDSDLPAKFKASKIYDHCCGEVQDNSDYTNITADVKAVLVHELHTKFRE